MNIPAGHQPPTSAAVGAPTALRAASRYDRTSRGGSAPPAVTHFALQYAKTATPGLPPIVFATEQVAVEADDEWWWEYYLDAPSGAASTAPLCVLRVRQRDVASSAGYASLQAAIANAHQVGD